MKTAYQTLKKVGDLLGLDCGVADEMYVLSASNKRVSVQLLGKDKIQHKLSQFEELTSASVSYMGVSTPGVPCHIGSIVPSKLVLYYFP